MVTCPVKGCKSRTSENKNCSNASETSVNSATSEIEENGSKGKIKNDPHFFLVPKDGKLRKKYAQALDRPEFVITDSTKFCHKHFVPEDIDNFKDVLDAQGNVIKRVCLLSACQFFINF